MDDFDKIIQQPIQPDDQLKALTRIFIRGLAESDIPTDQFEKVVQGLKEAGLRW